MQQESPAQHKDSILCDVKCHLGTSELKTQMLTRFRCEPPASLPTLVCIQKSATITGQDEGA